LDNTVLVFTTLIGILTLSTVAQNE
jgi:hypothetical protein